MPYIVISLFACITLAVPFRVYAAKVTSITGKIKAMFVAEKPVDEAPLATSQTMALFNPVIVDGESTTAAEVSEESNKESLQAVSGSLRVSTEDVDFPTTDTVSIYEVKKGDTLQDVAKLFNVSVNTIVWANNLPSRTINKGDILVILPVTGIKHNVKKGDTVTSIAKKYKADIGDVASYNGISSDASLAVGSTILVPDGEIEVVAPKPKPTIKKPKILDTYANTTPQNFLIRPVAGGRRTQGVHGHNGIDIAAAPGTPIVASASGKVLLAKVGGYNGGYGNMIIIAHEAGIQTVYAHLREVDVLQGQTVVQGQVIGEVGNTGKSTGPHLHFEVRGAKNPF